MAEGITFDPLGTVTVTLDGSKPYVLGRPKLRQFRKYRDLIRTLTTEAADKLIAKREELDAMKDSDPKYEKLSEEIQEITYNSFLLTSIPWLKEVFEDLGDPLPEDHDEWPAWLATDQSIPSQIITHWRTVPLAPGAKGTN